MEPAALGRLFGGMARFDDFAWAYIVETSARGLVYSASLENSAIKTNVKKTKPRKKWVSSVQTDSTHPPERLFTKSAAIIARSLASKKVSPKGPGSGMRMLTYFINRAGKGLAPTRRKELERAKALLSKRIKRERQQKQKAV